MKIFFNDKNIENELRTLAKGLKVDFDYKKTLNEVLDDSKTHEGSATGSEIPIDFVDLGKFIFSFFAQGVAYDLIKLAISEYFPKIVSKAKKQYKYFIIYYGESEDAYSKNTYFFIPVDLPQQEIDLAVDKSLKLMDLVIQLNTLTNISGSLRFYYSKKNGFTLVPMILPNQI